MGKKNKGKQGSTTSTQDPQLQNSKFANAKIGKNNTGSSTKMSKKKKNVIKQEFRKSSPLFQNKEGKSTALNNVPTNSLEGKPLSKNAKRKLKKLKSQEKDGSLPNYIPLESPKKINTANGKHKNRTLKQPQPKSKNSSPSKANTMLNLESSSEEDNEISDKNNKSNIFNSISDKKSTSSQTYISLIHKQTQTDLSLIVSEEMVNTERSEEREECEELKVEVDDDEDEDFGDNDNDENDNSEDEDEIMDPKAFLDDEAEEGEESIDDDEDYDELSEEEIEVIPPQKKMKYSQAEEKHEKPNQIEDENKVFINNLPSNATEEELRKALASVGTITSVVVPRNKENENQCRGFAFVTLQNKEALQNTIELDGLAKIGDNQLNIRVYSNSGRGGGEGGRGFRGGRGGGRGFQRGRGGRGFGGRGRGEGGYRGRGRGDGFRSRGGEGGFKGRGRGREGGFGGRGRDGGFGGRGGGNRPNFNQGFRGRQDRGRGGYRGKRGNSE